MDSDPPSPTQESEPKPEFRKLTNEAANRKYRRRSPGDGSPEEDGSPKRDNGSRRNSKVSDYERRNDDRVNDKSSSRSQHGRSSDSYRHSSRGYHNRHDEYSRHGKHADADDRSYAKSSSRSGRESRGGSNSDYRDREGDYNRSRDHQRDVDRYSRHGGRHDDRDRHARDRDDREEKRDGRSSRDHRGHRSDPSSKREMGDMKDLDGSKYSHEGKNNNDGLDTHEADGAGGVSEDKYAFVSEDFAAKKPKLFSLEESDARKDRSSSKQGEALVAKVTPEQAPANGSDSASNVDAAKVAAMKAAELVNKNLTSTGFMTADQKKKLLWGSKKNNNTEESSHRWDASLFSDRERQEKFQKLMGVKGEVKADTRSPSSQDAEKQKELQLDLEKQYTAGLRRRDGRTVGLGL